MIIGLVFGLLIRMCPLGHLQMLYALGYSFAKSGSSDVKENLSSFEDFLT